MKQVIFLILAILFGSYAKGQEYANEQEYPFTLAYCLDGNSTYIIDTNEKLPLESQIGYITFYKDKIIMDNKDVYHFWQGEGDVLAFKGPTLQTVGGLTESFIFLNKSLTDVQFFIHYARGDTYTVTKMHLMDIPSFMALLKQQNGMSNNIFAGNSYNRANYNSSSNDIYDGSKKYYEERYGYKDCHSCHGSGTCSTCHGDGLQHSPFGNDIPCANCLIENGKKTGKCSTCRGTGKVYGLK